MSSWGTALRIARREARRSKGRSSLVVAMIMIPVLALSFGVTAYDMFDLRAEERLARDLGAADARMTWTFNGPVKQDVDGEGYSTDHDVEHGATPTSEQLLALLPPGSRATPLEEGSIGVRTPTGIDGIDAWSMDVASPLARGMVTLLDGRAAERDSEITLTRQAAERLGAGIGRTVLLDDGVRAFTVVGLVEFPGHLNERIVFRPGVLSAALPADRQPWALPWLVDTPAPISWAEVKRLNQHGVLVRSRAVVLDPPPAAEVELPSFDNGPKTDELAIGVIVVGLAMLEVILLAGPAFAVGARRRRRELALVAANGGTPAHLRRIVLADGVVLGSLGAVAGVALGIVLAVLSRPLLEEYVTHVRGGGYRVFPLAQLAIIGLAVITGLCAALVPAFTTARQDVVLTLSGRRGITRSRKRWLALGLTMVAAGAVVVVLGAQRTAADIMLGGLVVGELGLVLCTPALVGLIARLGRVLPLAPRIALRDTARNRSSAAPAISAVMAAVAGSVAIAVYFGADQNRNSAEYTHSLPLGNAIAMSAQAEKANLDDHTIALTRAARETLPAGDVVPFRFSACAEPVPGRGGPGVEVSQGAVESRRCAPWAEMPASRSCPYWALDHEPTGAEQRAALRDRRCAIPQQYWINQISLQTVVDDGPALAALTGASGDELARATATLRAGGVVVGDPRYVEDGKITLNAPASDVPGTEPDTEPAEPHKVTLPGYGLTGAPKALIVLSSGSLPALGLSATPAGVVVTTSRAPTTAEADAFRAAVKKVSASYQGEIERGPTQTSEDQLTMLIIAIAAGLITLGAAGIATGLAAADGRADLATLAAVGASPRVRRALSLSQSGMISGLGSLLGAGAGLGAAIAVLTALNRRYAETWPTPAEFPIAVPWLNLGIALLIVPAVAMLGAGLLTRSRLPIERRL